MYERLCGTSSGLQKIAAACLYHNMDGNKYYYKILSIDTLMLAPKILYDFDF